MISAGKPRHFVWDAVVALAFFLLAAILGKLAARILTPIGGLFVFAICAAIGYAHARSAWLGFSSRRLQKKTGQLILPGLCCPFLSR